MFCCGMAQVVNLVLIRHLSVELHYWTLEGVKRLELNVLNSHALLFSLWR